MQQQRVYVVNNPSCTLAKCLCYFYLAHTFTVFIYLLNGCVLFLLVTYISVHTWCSHVSYYLRLLAHYVHAYHSSYCLRISSTACISVYCLRIYLQCSRIFTVLLLLY
ncbi:hypothetical protein BGX38DRAFT_699410 [Terfezia claveryi]|nr:hypothetical protein BGX38DRAFT_699410 [Terfezia claveryi]